LSTLWEEIVFFDITVNLAKRYTIQELIFPGASYGTALGQIFAAMFPEKVDKMVLDGVLNPHEYIAGR
jgi:pimeloyl-ACP methyl ester carboxylesterase